MQFDFDQYLYFIRNNRLLYQYSMFIFLIVMFHPYIINILIKLIHSFLKGA